MKPTYDDWVNNKKLFDFDEFKNLKDWNKRKMEKTEEQIMQEDFIYDLFNEDSIYKYTHR